MIHEIATTRGTDAETAGYWRIAELDSATDRIKRIAQRIDEVTAAIWDVSGLAMKLVLIGVLVITATSIPLIPLAIMARYIAKREES